MCNSSLCGETADLRGLDQRVVSYSLYGPRNERYFNGIKENVDLIREIYPAGYTMRIYHDKSWERDQLQVSSNKPITFCAFSKYKSNLANR